MFVLSRGNGFHMAIIHGHFRLIGKRLLSCLIAYRGEQVSRMVIQILLQISARPVPRATRERVR